MKAHWALILSCGALVLAFDALAIDSDNDTVNDASDNCTYVANKGQEDDGSPSYPSDGYGNACDADLNNDGITGGPDFALLGQCLSLPGQGARNDCRDRDFNSDNKVNGADQDLFEDMFLTPPGPSCCAP
jgi:hypothetical protein